MQFAYAFRNHRRRRSKPVFESAARSLNRNKSFSCEDAQLKQG
jgi:hypothetical protein